uniref:Uncharacterized protein n=1 Tax=viral metagenome TaxID=1070528 RepID=A0A6C0ET74_9ZZZZ
MLKLKFSPLLLFIILLVVLIFSTIICKTCFFNSSNTEGFVSYRYDIDTTTSQNQYLVNLPQYSKDPVIKLYDNLFFDKFNGNIIEVDSINYPNIAGNISIDTTGSSITNIYVNTRNNINRLYITTVNSSGAVIPTNVAESLTKSVTTSFFPWTYLTATDRTDKYQLFYMPWAESTYIHIIKIYNRNGTNSNNNGVYGNFRQVHVMSYLFGSGSAMSNKYYSSSSQPPEIQTQNDDNDPNNDKYVYDDLYDEKKSVYQLSKYIRFDKSNGNLIIRGKSPENSITIYKRNNGGNSDAKSTVRVNNTSSTLENSEFNSFIVSDNYQYIVLYLPISTKTMIVLLKISKTNSNRFEIQKVVRFNQDGIETETGTNSTTSTTSTTSTNSSNDFYRNYWLSSSDSENQCMSEDYLLKTQIVPPVCPSCPSCAYSAGTCSNCGGAGGSGTLNSNGQTLIDNGNVPKNVSATALVTSGGAVVSGTTGSDKPVSNAVDQTTNTLNTTVGTAGVLGGQTLDTTADILKSTGSGASDLLKSGASGTSDLLKSGASGATDLLKTTASGATDLLKSGASGATDLLKSAGTGLKEIATDNRQAARTSGAAAIAGTAGTGSGVMGAGVSTRGLGGIDSYSYYGALVPKGGNYMPVTADFSAFAK